MRSEISTLGGSKEVYLVAGTCDEKMIIAWAERDGKNFAIVCCDALFGVCTCWVACIPTIRQVRYENVLE